MFKAIKCFYRGCKRPKVVEVSAAGERPSDAKFWSDPATWENGLPVNDSVVTIKGMKSLVTVNCVYREFSQRHHKLNCSPS